MRLAEQGTLEVEVCRKLGVSKPTFHARKKKYAGKGAPELRKVRQLEEENRKLKQLVADLRLDKQPSGELTQRPSISLRIWRLSDQ